MKRILMIVAMLVCFMSNSALAFTDVQLNDELSLHEILARYNQDCRNNMETRDMLNSIVSESPVMVNMKIMDNTTSYSTSGAQNVMILAAVNGNGKVSQFVIISPSSMEKTINGLYAIRLIMAVDPRGDKNAVAHNVAKAVSTDGVAFYESYSQNRIYTIAHETTANGGNMTIIGASVP